MALLPVRYAGTPLAEGGPLAMARQTEWLELSEGAWRGIGQRVLSSDGPELGLLEVHSISFDNAPAAA